MKALVWLASTIVGLIVDLIGLMLGIAVFMVVFPITVFKIIFIRKQ